MDRCLDRLDRLLGLGLGLVLDHLRDFLMAQSYDGLYDGFILV